MIAMDNGYELVLASGSPRRQQLMSALGFDFVVRTAGIDESPQPTETATDLAVRLCTEKAKAVARLLPSDGAEKLILAADTVVALDDMILGKPDDAAHAREMLEQLRGRVHQVHSAVCVLRTEDGDHRACVNTTQVKMRDYTGEEISNYISTGDPFDKAGAYAIQHSGFAPVRAVDGCITGVMGLPLGDVCALLREFGVDSGCRVPEVCEQHTSFACCQRDAGQSSIGLRFD